MGSLYSLDINSLLEISLANIFSHSVGCVFVLLVVPFAARKLFGLMSSHLSVFVFVSLAVGVKSTKTF